MRSALCMLVAIPATLDESDFEDEMVEWIAKYSKRLAKRVSVFIDPEGKDSELEPEEDDDGVPLQELRVTFGNLEPHETATIQALVEQLLTDPESYICGTVIDSDAGDENEEVDDDADWWKDA